MNLIFTKSSMISLIKSQVLNFHKEMVEQKGQHKCQ